MEAMTVVAAEDLNRTSTSPQYWPGLMRYNTVLSSLSDITRNSPDVTKYTPSTGEPGEDKKIYSNDNINIKVQELRGMLLHTFSHIL